MTIIEVILPDGSIRAHLTAAREAATIAQEVRFTYPEASHWRIGRGWQGAAGETRSMASAMGLWLRAAFVAALLLAVVLLLLSFRQGISGMPEPAPENVTASQPSSPESQAQAGAAITASALPSQDIIVASVAEQASDTSRTLLVHLTNTGAQTHANIMLQATFYDRNGQAVRGEQMGDNLTLGPGQTGSIKVWARSEAGIERYELAILD